VTRLIETRSYTVIPMFKVAWMTRFKRGLAEPEARRHWQEVHGPLAAKAGGLERYVQNHVVEDLGAGRGAAQDELRVDGYSIGWFGDEAGFAETTRSPEWQELRADGLELFDYDAMWGRSAVLEEHVIKEGPEGPFKVAWVVSFHPGQSAAEREETRRHWLEIHGPIAAEAPGLDRYVQNHAVAGVGADGVTGTDGLVFGGISEGWYASREAYDECIASEPWSRLTADGQPLWHALWVVNVRELRVK
jgi:hypothetical protein